MSSKISPGYDNLIDEFDKTPSPINFKFPSPPKDNVSLVKKMPIAPTHTIRKTVKNKSNNTNKKENQMIDKYVNDVKQAIPRAIALDYLEKAMKKEKNLKNAIMLAKVRLSKDLNSVKRQKQSRKGGRKSSKRKTSKRKTSKRKTMRF
tara:strand:- start:49 stop:492 length:444 start_codon:yes stop_codon:yes gene_type:complete